MDRFFTPKNNINLEQNTCIIEGEDVKHISRVLRSRENDKLEVCDMDNNEYICEIREINKDNILLDIIEKVNIKRESNLKVKLYQGMPKGTKMELILQKLTEIGVDEIVLVQAKRSVTKIDNKKEDKKIERWERIIYEAAKQSKRGKIPKISCGITFEEILRDLQYNVLNICSYENERTISIKEAIKDSSANTIGIFVGPEGGFEEEEIEKIQEIDGKVVSLGPRILRTETASVVASSIVLYELSDLGGNI